MRHSAAVSSEVGEKVPSPKPTITPSWAQVVTPCSSQLPAGTSVKSAVGDWASSGVIVGRVLNLLESPVASSRVSLSAPPFRLSL